MATVLFQDDFEWDDVKATSNVKDHGIAFEEAATVFEDPRAIDEGDADHPGRIRVLGRSAVNRVLFVVHAEAGERFRIISARKVTPRERRKYEAGG